MSGDGAGRERSRIPADVEREDRILAGLTARQLAVLAVAAVVLWAAYIATRRLVPLALFAVVGAPVRQALAVALALGRFEGVAADRWSGAAWRHHRSPRRLVPAPGAILAGAVPAGLGIGPAVGPTPSPLRLPFAGVAPDGMVDLGADGVALICRASAVTFSLRTPGEQEALVAGFGRWLNSLAAPVQIVVRAEPIDLARRSSSLSTTHRGSRTPPWRPLPTAMPGSWPSWPRTTTCSTGRCSSSCGNRPETTGPGACTAGPGRRPPPSGPPGWPSLSSTGPTPPAAWPKPSTRPGRPGHRAPPGPTSPSPWPPAGLADERARLNAPGAAPGRRRRSGLTPSKSALAPCEQGTAGAGAFPSSAIPARSAPAGSSPSPPTRAALTWPCMSSPSPPSWPPTGCAASSPAWSRDGGADVGKGRLIDPDVEVAAADARDLAARLARGEQKLFRVGLYLTVHAGSEAALEAECARARALCASVLFDAQPATWRSLQGWVSTLPLGVDAIGQRRTFDTAALAASFPFASAELTRAQRRAVRHRHQRLGAGALGPLRLRQPQLGDPRPLRGRQVLPGQAGSVALPLPGHRDRRRRPRGRVPPLGRGGGRRLRTPGGARGALQPFRPAPRGPAALTRRALFVHTLVAVLLGAKPDAAGTAALDRGIVAAYQAAGVTADPRSHGRPAPLLADLAAALRSDDSPVARDLAARLAPFVTGTHRGLFDGPTTTRAGRAPGRVLAARTYRAN